MVVQSKLFQPPLNQLACSAFMHPLTNQSCMQAFLWNLFRNHVSSARYYLPTLLLPLLFNFRKLSRSRVRAIVENYLKTTTWGAMTNAFICFSICIFRHIVGHFVRGCVPFLPSYLATQTVWLMPDKVLLFLNTGVTSAALESLLRQLDMGVVRSRATQTLVFMLCSLVVLRAHERKQYSGFWFIKPSQLPEDYTKWTHRQRIEHGLHELRNYLGIGVALDVFNGLLHGKLTRLQLRSTSFMGSYFGLYRLLQCLLTDKMNAKAVNLLAALGSGTAFRLVSHVPLTFMSFAVLIACQVLWQEFCAKDVSSKETLTALQRLHWARLVFPFSMSFLVDRYFLRQEVVSGLGQGFIDATSDNLYE
ncbi:hypothetical protein KR222_002406 [Zaprionus bogoriensis]|nr:hypothetical protein KR222_002406 [Zaprionus bogoriensis]